jgi:hypothetical protein
MYDYARLCITGDVVTIIANHLEPVDIETLCIVHPPNWKKLKPLPKFRDYLIGKKIDKYFREAFGDRYADFRNVMIAHDIVVSGSFIISMILNEFWADSDIDFFASYDPLTYANNNLECVFSQLSPDWSGILGRYVIFNTPQLDTIHEVLTFDIKAKNYQVISLQFGTNLREFIENSFDFDVCKNMFYYDKTGLHLSIRNYKDILAKEVGFKPGHDINTSLQRCQKYRDRGFKFYNAMNPADQNYAKYTQMLQDRHDLNHRGFLFGINVRAY